MTYRSDHDAALHRLDTLERELAEIKAAKPAEVVAISPPPPRSRAWLALGMVGWLAAAGVGAWKLVGGPSDGEASAAADPPVADTDDRSELRACARSIEPTSPELAPTLAPCRPLLHLYGSLDLTPDERGLVAMWARAEDALALAVTALRNSYSDEVRARYETLLVERAAVLHALAL